MFLGSEFLEVFSAFFFYFLDFLGRFGNLFFEFFVSIQPTTVHHNYY
jgi:hypothetical protein